MAHDYEWVIETHPKHEPDIEELFFERDIDGVNSSLKNIDDPIEINLCKCFYDDDNRLLRRERNYVDFATMQFDPSQKETAKIPQKYIKQLSKLNQPRSIFDPNRWDEDEGE